MPRGGNERVNAKSRTQRLLRWWKKAGGGSGHEGGKKAPASLSRLSLSSIQLEGKGGTRQNGEVH
jgi:hypothetical protein